MKNEEIELVQNSEMLGIPIKDWFAYHDTKTDARREKHEAINTLAKHAGLLYKSDDASDVEEFNSVMNELADTISIPELRSWAFKNIIFSDKDTPFDTLMKVQQWRMIAHQAAAYEELLVCRI